MPFLAGVSVEDVSAVVTIMSLKRDSRLIAHKLESGWFVGVVRRRPEKTVQFAVKCKCGNSWSLLINTSTSLQAELVQKRVRTIE